MIRELNINLVKIQYNISCAVDFFTFSHTIQYLARKCLVVDDHFDISGVFEISKFEIVRVALFKKD